MLEEQAVVAHVALAGPEMDYDGLGQVFLV